MTYEEAQAEITELRGFANEGQDLAIYKDRIASLYWHVCRKRLRSCRCKDKYRDAILEIYAKLKKAKGMDSRINDVTARLVAGVILRVNGQMYSNYNLTDEAARAFLEQFPQRTDWFEVLPPAVTAKEVVAEVAEMPENTAEIASTEVKVENKPTAPKKKKTSKKRK